MQFPTNFVDAETVAITSKTLTHVTNYGLNTLVSKHGQPHQWQVEFRTVKLEPDSIMALNAFLNSLDGRYGVFTLPNPTNYTNAAVDFPVTASASAGENSISVGSLPVATTNALKAGNFIKFASHDKVYQISSNASSSGSGTATMNIYPALRENITAGDTVENATFTLRLMSDNNTLELDAAAYSIGKSVMAVENV